MSTNIPEKDLNSWARDLYRSANQYWVKSGRNPKGFAIFYSPIRYNPELMIIGLNPGGGSFSFIKPMEGPPEKHEYIEEDYRIAHNMKKIFPEPSMRTKLKDSVKLNLFFFRSKDWKSLEISNEAKNFSEESVKDIVHKLQPKKIIAEGFQTYERLKALLGTNGEEVEMVSSSTKGKRIVRACEIKNHIPLIGITHPSSTRGLTNKMLEEIGAYLENVV